MNARLSGPDMSLNAPVSETDSGASDRQDFLVDTVPLPEHKRIPKIETVSVAPLLAEAIRRIHSGGSVGAMFRPPL